MVPRCWACAAHGRPAGGRYRLGELLGEGHVLLHVSKDLEASGARAQEDINRLFSAAAGKGWKVAGLSPATAEEAEAYRAEHGLTYPMYATDPTELKIIVRSNPGVVLLKDGVVQQKWAWRDVPVDLGDMISTF